MGQVVKFPGHRRARCGPQCGERKGRGCNWCSLFVCATCGGAEASLPTHCPQERMDASRQDAVQARAVDFRDGQWRYYGYAATEVFDA